MNDDARAKWIADLVLDVFADDYENFEMIEKEVKEWTGDDKQPIPTRTELLNALRVLTAEEYAQAYLYNDATFAFAPVPYAEQRLQDLWFYATPKGIEHVKRHHSS